MLQCTVYGNIIARVFTTTRIQSVLRDLSRRQKRGGGRGSIKVDKKCYYDDSFSL